MINKADLDEILQYQLPDFLREGIEYVVEHPNDDCGLTQLNVYINSAEIDHGISPSICNRIRRDVLYA